MDIIYLRNLRNLREKNLTQILQMPQISIKNLHEKSHADFADTELHCLSGYFSAVGTFF